MRVRRLHRWDLEPKEAIQLQRQLAEKVIEGNGPDRLRRIGAADVSYDRQHDLTVAAVAVFSYPDLELEAEELSHGRIGFPYIPDLLSFREVPVLLECFAKLHRRPDVVLMDGHGRAHPRRFGLASHMGLLLDLPTIGCAKSRLVGRHERPRRDRGAWKPLVDGSEVIGVALTSKSGTLPIYVSVGHKIQLRRAVEIVLSCCRGGKHPEPLRHADRRVAQRRREVLAGPGFRTPRRRHRDDEPAAPTRSH